MRLNLGFVFGANGKNADATFTQEKELAKKMIDKFEISKTSTSVGAIVYDSNARLAWRLGDLVDARSNIYNIDQLRRLRKGGNVLKALEIARDDLFSLKNGARRDVPSTLILFIDKIEARDQRLEDTANQLKDKGVKVVVIVIGPEVDKKDVAGIASSPNDLIKPLDLSKSMEDVMSQAVAQSKPGKMIFWVNCVWHNLCFDASLD